MSYWLLKTEPSTFSLEDLQKAPRKTTSWEGVRNYQARNFIRDQMKKGDEAFMYYSSCPEPGIAAIVKLSAAPYADPTAFERRSEYFDEASKRDQPRWFTADIQLQRPMKRIIPLEELRAHANGKLKGMLLLRAGNRLSVTPVEDAHWRFILTIE